MGAKQPTPRDVIERLSQKPPPRLINAQPGDWNYAAACLAQGGGSRCRSCGVPTTGSLDIVYVDRDERRQITVPICPDCARKGFDGERVDIRFDESEVAPCPTNDGM